MSKLLCIFFVKSMRLRGWSYNTALQLQDGGRHHIQFLINANNFVLDGHMSTRLGAIIKSVIAK